ncbi:MAG TPA: hypothetical protein PLW67_00070 [Prolixibacteraceae bacterium]|nr:hypothetical protein [Prolixibacteraceae bacterium]
MKKLISEVIFLLLLLGACQQEPEWQEKQMAPVSGNGTSRDQLHDALAKTLALAIQDEQVRLFLYNELEKQFTGDYDILFDLVRDKVIETEHYGTMTLSGLLEKKALEAGIDLRFPVKGSTAYLNLQISAPSFFEDWNPETYTPEVISLPVDYQENTMRMVRSFHEDGRETLVVENNLSKPFLLVRQAERVDENGMMRVDPDGFVIPDEERVFSAREVYEMSETGLKSAIVTGEEPVIQVLDDEAFQNALLSRRSPAKDAPAPVIRPEGGVEYSTLKSAGSVLVDTPGNVKVNPAAPFTIQVSWSQVSGAVKYEVFRQYEYNPNYLLATLDAQQISFTDRYLSQGEHYTYSVRSVDASGNVSPLTAGLESYASWRTNGYRDVVDRIILSSACWNWCCGLFDGKIELQYKISYLLTPSNTVAAYPSVGMNNLGQKTKDQQKGKWCTYNHYLFPWDVKNSSYSYRFKLIEDDGSGETVTVKLGNTFKVQLSKILEGAGSSATEFKIADKDEEFGEIIIQYWDWKCGFESYHDGYNLIPKDGSARMYLKQ